MTVKRTSSFVSRVIAISLLLIAVTTATAQSRKDATADKKLTAQKDTVAFFRGVAVSADMVGLAQLAFSDYGQYEAALADGLDNQDIKASLRGIQSGLCDGFYTVGMNEKETGYKVASVGESINRNIDALRFEGAANTCKVTTAIHEEGEKTRALITCNTMQALRDKLADKDRELLYLKLKMPATTTAAA